YGGGIIYHVSKDSSGNDHGLILSLVHQSLGAPWDSINVPNTTMWNGKANSDSIIAAGGLPTHAAGLCTGYNGGGFNDWYLPSYHELSMISTVVYDLNNVLIKTSGAALI